MRWWNRRISWPPPQQASVFLDSPPAAEGGLQVPRDSLAGGVEPPVAAKAADVAFKMLHNIRPLRACLPPLGCSRGPTV